MKPLSYTSSPRLQSGYSLVEWMIAIVLILVVTAGIFKIFISSRQSTIETLASSEREESAAFAMQLLVRDLKHAYLFAQGTGEDGTLWDDATIPTIADDCIDDANLGSFPNAADVYRPLWSGSVSGTGSATMNCINDSDNNTNLIANSDYISIKRTRGLVQDSDFEDDRYYLGISIAKISVYLGNNADLIGEEVDGVDVAPIVETAWEYIHHVYYLDEEDDIPRLRRLALVDNKMELQGVIAEGIEDMEFMFALDNLIISSRTGTVSAFVSPSEVTSNDWNTGRVIGMKVFLLARSLKETNGYVNNDSYQLGDRTFVSPGDGYKRSVSSQVITFPNSVVYLDE